MEYGLSGLIQPVMDYSASYCDYECNLCSRVCPTGAIEEITLEEKKKIQLGRVQLIPDYCIVFAKNQACGACAEHCPTTAVRMFLYEGNGLPAPEIHPDLCVGCGHCENVCPARPTKAIYVRGLDIHQEAKQPEKGEIKKKKEDDFPF
jgi:ferredoxin